MKLAIIFGILLCCQVIFAQEAEEGSGAEEAVEESSGLKFMKKHTTNFKFWRHFLMVLFFHELQEMPVMNQSVRMVLEMGERKSVWKERGAKEVQ